MQSPAHLQSAGSAAPRPPGSASWQRKAVAAAVLLTCSAIFLAAIVWPVVAPWVRVP